MKNLLMSLISFLFLCTTASAALLTNEGSNGKLEDVSLSLKSSTTIEGETIKLSQIGAGLRSKKIAFMSFNVYVAELFVSTPEKFKRSESEVLTSLKEQKAVAIQLHFLRTVDAETVKKSFNEALQKNEISLEDSNIKSFLDGVTQGGKVEKGKVLTILGAKLKDGSEEITYESTSRSVSSSKGSAGFINKIFSIWLGKSTDEDLAHLKSSILKD